MTEQVKNLIAKYAQMIAQQAADTFEETFSDLNIEAESPIEQLMAAALLYALKSSEYYGHGEGYEGAAGWNEIFAPSLPGTFETLNPKYKDERGIQIHMQFPIGRYRADFFVDFKHRRGSRVMAVIECDGHDFHERTKQQAAHDKARDRYFQSLGLLVLRYTGSEIYKDPLAAAFQALRIIEDRAMAAARAMRA